MSSPQSKGWMISAAHKRITPPLIVDPSDEFEQFLKSDPKAKKLPFKYCHGFAEAKLALESTGHSYSAIFLNPALGTPNQKKQAIDLLRLSFTLRPAMPIFLLMDKDRFPFTDDQLQKLPIQRTVSKPVTYTGIIDQFSPFFVSAKEGAIRKIKPMDAHPLGKELRAEDHEFVPVPSSAFINGIRPFCDLFVRLQSGRYLKLLYAGDSFTWERISTYLKKGVDYFFFKKDHQEYYLDAFTELQRIVMNQEAEQKARIDWNPPTAARPVLMALDALVVAETALRFAFENAKNLQETLKSLSPESNPTLQAFTENEKDMEHGYGTLVVAYLIARFIPGLSSMDLQLLGISALFHDIGLHRLSEKIRQEDELQMSPSEMKLFHKHPVIGAKLLAQHPTMPKGVEPAVAQHHERINGMGFPLQLTEVHPLAQIVGLACLMTHALEKSQTLSGIDPFLEVRAELSGFSPAVVSALLQAFQRRP